MNSPLRLIRDADGIASVVFDKPDSGANVFDASTLDALSAALDELASAPPRGVVFTSAKPKIFLAGADIGAFSKVAGPDAARALSRRGQDLFNRVADLPCPSVAALHGQTLGGGCELALACDWRIASDDPATRVGLPEIQLGILPAWGGCHRLPRLLGLPAALDIILAGKALPAVPARKRGLVDQIVPRDHFSRLASAWIARGKRPAPRFRGTEIPPLTWIVGRKARAAVLARTRGLYPAPLKALEVVLAGLGRPRADALRLEQEALAELMATPECRNLVRVFFLQEAAKKRRVEDAPPEPPPTVRRVLVVGAGVMGAGIAHWHAARGNEVLLRDVNPDALNAGLRRIQGWLDEATRRHALSRPQAARVRDRLLPILADAPLPRVDLAVEAAPEKLELKQALFAELDARLPPDALLCTNTSALSIDALAGAVRDPSRVVGLHYFNPVHKMQLVEVVRGARSSPAAVARAVAFAREAGKLPVVVRDRPGFLVNRVLLPYLVEAGLLLEQGADPQVIDDALLDFGMPMGPLRLLDEVGADVGRHVAEFLAASFPDHMATPAILTRLVEAGALGRKSGRGVYLYPGGRSEAKGVNPDLARWRAGAHHGATPPGRLRDRMLFLLINECARVLEEGVAESAADVDFALVFGAGFAPFRGGPLRYADALGAGTLVAALDALAASEGPRFAPCARLRHLADKGEPFHPADRG
jgi:3-hydroxyacyl-CoA dehydrogenase/enoyl-CoA hydratase/3-hydroxybutyryl-CoA epimerase